MDKERKKIQSEVRSEETFEFVKKQSAIEDIKEKSSYLRGTIGEELKKDEEFF